MWNETTTNQEALAHIRRVMRYDSKTGFMMWRIGTTDKSAKERGRVGTYSKDKARYPKTKILGRTIDIHRVVWLFHYGQLPEFEIDHIDGDRQNSRITNLRAATRIQNGANLIAMKKASTGYSRTRNGKYQAQIVVAQKIYRLGRFDTKREARMAYEEASKETRGEFSPV